MSYIQWNILGKQKNRKMWPIIRRKIKAIERYPEVTLQNVSDNVFKTAVMNILKNLKENMNAMMKRMVGKKMMNFMVQALYLNLKNQ